MKGSRSAVADVSLASARVSLDRAQRQIEDEGQLADLAPGRAVTVEIKTGARRVIDHLLSPLLRSSRRV